MRKFVLAVLIVVLGVLGFTIIRQKLFSSPVPTPSPESTYKPGSTVIYHGNRNNKSVALTFDADMTPKMKKELLNRVVTSWYNKDIIGILREKKIPATLFLTGMWAEIYPEEVKDLASDPLFEIGNHSYSHPAFATPCYTLRGIPNNLDSQEIEKTQKILTDITGKIPHFFRFPGGCFDNNDVSIVHSEGLDVIGWDIASGDAFSKSSASIISRVVSKIKPGSIIVMHMMGGPNAPETARALPAIIERLQKEGYKFVKISDILK